MDFPSGSAGKESACSVGDLGLIPALGRSPGEGNSYPLQYSGLENSMDSPWGCKELDMTERHSLSLLFQSPPAGDRTNAQFQCRCLRERIINNSTSLHVLNSKWEISCLPGSGVIPASSVLISKGFQEKTSII